jgi:hypothetical protein
MYKRTATLLSTIPIALCLACSAGDQPQSSEPAPAPGGAVDELEKYVVHRIEVEPKHVVTFYEPSPGVLLLIERMVPGQRSVVHGRGSADALLVFSRVRPNDEIPARLREAYERAQELTTRAPAGEHPPGGFGGGSATPDEGAGSASTGEVSASASALTSSSSATVFVNDNDGCDNWGASVAGICRVSWWNGFWAGYTSNAISCLVDHFSGNGITVEISYPYPTNISAPTQSSGTIQAYAIAVGGNVYRKVDILNASGDGFHVGCSWDN